MLKHQAPPWTKGLRRWLPLAGGDTLLGFLGFSGVRTDVGGHVAGFLAGSAVGAPLFVASSRVPRGTMAPSVFGASAIALFVRAWLWAFARGNVGRIETCDPTRHRRDLSPPTRFALAWVRCTLAAEVKAGK
jgi:hypothetical protein